MKRKTKISRSVILTFLNRSRWVVIIFSVVTAILVWYGLILIFRFPENILPSPQNVVKNLWLALTEGTLLQHTWFTLSEVILGLLAGTTAATILGYLLAKAPIMERVVSPFLVASQAIPMVAIAPLLILWFGKGIGTKVLISALTVFFPVLVNTVVGLRTVPSNLRTLFRSLNATRFQMLFHLEIPSALPVLLGGLRVGATLSVIGAVVGEFVASDRGLGFFINSARGLYNTALVFAGIFVLVLMALLLYGFVALLERSLLRWQRGLEPGKELE